MNCPLLFGLKKEFYFKQHGEKKMSDAKEMSLFDQIKTQHAQFVAQRDQIIINFQQLVGAIAACELMMNTHEEALKKQPAVKEEVSDSEKKDDVNDEEE